MPTMGTPPSCSLFSGLRGSTSSVVLVLFAVMLLKLVLSKVPCGVASIASIANHRGSPSNGFANAAFRGTPVASTENRVWPARGECSPVLIKSVLGLVFV